VPNGGREPGRTHVREEAPGARRPRRAGPRLASRPHPTLRYRGRAPAGQPHCVQYIPMIAPYGSFRTADGFLNLAVGNDGMFRSLCESLDLAELPSDPRFVDN